jgi:hypothetical protein
VCVKENVGWTFDECIDHVLEDHKLLYLYYYSWNDKYYWINSGGSHHFAVANYIATNEKIDYFFDCNITSFHIDEETVKELINNYELFIIHKKFHTILHKCLIEIRFVFYRIDKIMKS